MTSGARRRRQLVTLVVAAVAFALVVGCAVYAVVDEWGGEPRPAPSEPPVRRYMDVDGR